MARIRLLAVIAVMALLVVACGDSGDEADGGDGGEQQIAVIATDFAFTPDAYLVEPGSQVTVEVTNEGSIEHNWVLLSTPIESEDQLDEANYLAEAIAQPGASGSVTFAAPAAGDYQVVCDIAGHFAAGMEGDLTVTG